MKRLGRTIKTIDDVLCLDDVNDVISNLLKQKADVAELVVIRIGHTGIARIATSTSPDSTLAALVRAQHFYIQAYSHPLDIEGEEQENGL